MAKSKIKSFNSIIIAILIIVISVVGLALSTITIQNSNHTQKVYDVNSLDSKESDQIYVKMEIPNKESGEKNQWKQTASLWGAQYDIYLTNNTYSILEDYSVQMTSGSELIIDSSWNGKYMLSTDKKTITMEGIAEADNQEIKPGQTVKFGMVLHTPLPLKSADFKIIGYYEQQPFNSPFFILSGIALIAGILVLIISVIIYSLINRQFAKTDEKVDNLLFLLAKLIDSGDSYTKKHSVNVADISRKIAGELGLSAAAQNNIYYDAILHDIGMLSVSHSILQKESPLTQSEVDEIKKHTSKGSDYIQGYEDIPNLTEAVLYHHEHFDGSGYPMGLKSSQIPLVARIIAVADAYDAMSNDRAYREKLPIEKIISEFENNAGTQFDPKITRIAVNLIKSGRI